MTRMVEHYETEDTSTQSLFCLPDVLPSPNRIPDTVSMETRLNEINHTFQKLWTALSPYLTPDMAEFILAAPRSQIRLYAKKQELTALFADICGFTSLAEMVDPEECVRILNEYFRLAVDTVYEFEGTVDKFQGDCVMATFGPLSGRENHERRAVKCAIRL